MAKIFVLPRSVINIIAAGEVAERPAVIVKELVENSLDAGASSIKIFVQNGGREKIVVSDNGHGMDHDDVLLSIQRHTTSKIRTPEDLEKVKSFGFRGEALASIASVSTLTIASKTADSEVGHQIVVENEEVIEDVPVGMPTGTVITVENLFQNIPARLKFLKSPQTEFRQVLEIITQASLIHPEVQFQLSHNQKSVLTLTSHPTPAERVYSLLGKDTYGSLIPFHADHTFLTFTGFIGKPQLARRSSPQQFLFVNNRPVSSSTIATAIKEAYGSLLEPRSNPAFILNITLPPHLTDLNVHPRKEVIQFMDEPQVLELLKKSVAEKLSNSELTYTPQLHEEASSPLSDELPFRLDRTGSQLTKTLMKSAVSPWQTLNTTNAQEIQQLHNTYLVAQTPEGVMLVDQHAAHERIIYQQMVEGLRNQTQQLETVVLAKPLTLSLSPADTAIVEEHLSTLHKIGFHIDALGGNTFKVTHVPKLLQDRNIPRLLSEFISDLSAGKPVRGVDTLAERTIAYIACRSAVKAGDPLSPEQRKQLLLKLSETENKFTCPHGRPTTIVFSVTDLEKMFRRR